MDKVALSVPKPNLQAFVDWKLKNFLDRNTIRAGGERVWRELPWPTGWEDWRAPTEWTTPELPAGWND